MDHRVERAFVESHVDRVGGYVFHVADVCPAPFDSLLFRVTASHKLQRCVGEVQAELVLVAARGEVGRNGLVGAGGSAHGCTVSRSASMCSYAIAGAQVDDLGLLLRGFRSE